MELPFVKKFDIRGRYGVDITDENAFYLGLAIEKTFSPKHVLLGWDTRISSRELAFNVINALKGSNIEISYMDQCPIEFVTAASNVMDFDISIMFTGSHNTWDWTGLLMHTKGGESVKDDLVEALVKNYETVLYKEYMPEPVDLSLYKNVEKDVRDIYEERLRRLIPLNQIQECSIAVDVGDGSGYKGLEIFEKLLPQVHVTRLNDRRVYNSNSSHTADPSQAENMIELQNDVKQDEACLAGFAFDSDADRILAVDANGEIINGSMLGGVLVYTMIYYLKSLNQKYGYSIECGSSLYNSFMSLNYMNNAYSVVPVPVGRSILRGMIRANEIDFSAENVGHFYCRDFFETDSSIYTMMLTLLWMSQGNNLADIFENNPDGMRFQDSVPLGNRLDIDSKLLLDTIKSDFPDLRQITVDGIRGEILQHQRIIGWFCIRHSGYEKIAKYYFGATDPEKFDYLQNLFEYYKV